jgi:hypothetical protein
MIVEPLQMIAAAAFPDGEPIPVFEDERIAAAEARLKLAIPDAVKDYYAVAGARDLKRVYYSMLPPEKLRVDGEQLIFCEENEGLEDFGISLEALAALAERPNPSVHVRRQGELRWFAEAGNVSAFLLGMEAWQVVLSLPEKTRCNMQSNELKGLLAFFEPVGGPKVRLGSQYFGMVDRKNAIVAAYMHTSETLYVGSARANALDELKNKSQLNFEPL